MENESRLIDAKVLAENVYSLRLYVMTGMRNGKTLLYECMEKYRNEVLRTICKAPTVDAVEVVHGRWIPSDIDVEEYEQCMSDANDWYDWECSVCHYQMSYVDPVQRKHLTNYCPNCGAKMDRGEEK